MWVESFDYLCTLHLSQYVLCCPFFPLYVYPKKSFYDV